MYSKDIIKNGKITKKYNPKKDVLNMFHADHLFNSSPDYKKYPFLKKNKELIDIQKTVDGLTKITKPIFITFSLTVLSLIVLLNIFEG